MPRTPLLSLATMLLLFTAGGAGCPYLVRQQGTPIPAVLPPSASLDQYIDVVNRNTAGVRSGMTSQAMLTVPGAPQLRADLAFELPRRFRLRASTPLTGAELDVGMNDELFWLWVKRNQPPAMFFCRHEQFARSSVRNIVPVEPEWFIDALGLPQFTAQEQHEGPFKVSAGRVEIKSRRQSAVGELTKITILDETRGLVLEQHLYDAHGQRIATALTKNHVRDGLAGVNMPRQIDIDWPSSQMKFRIDVGSWNLNTLSNDQAGLWTKPEYSGFPNVDLADPNLQINMPQQPAAATGPGRSYTPADPNTGRGSVAGPNANTRSAWNAPMAPDRAAGEPLPERRGLFRRLAPPGSMRTNPGGNPQNPGGSDSALAPPVVELPTQ